MPPSWILFLCLLPTLPGAGKVPFWIWWLFFSCGHVTMLPHLVLSATLWKGHYAHVTDEETETQGDQYLSMVTQQVGKRVEVQSQVGLIWNLGPFYCILHPEDLVPLLVAPGDCKGSSSWIICLSRSGFVSFTFWFLNGTIFKLSALLVCKAKAPTQLGRGEMRELHSLFMCIWTACLSLNTPLLHACLPEGQLCMPCFTGPMPLGSYLWRGFNNFFRDARFTVMIMYLNVKSPCCTPEVNWYVNYTSAKNT